MLIHLKESNELDKFKDPTIEDDVARWNDTKPHYNIDTVIPARDVTFELIHGHEDHGKQPILYWNGKRLRPRAEMIVFNSKGQILVRDNPKYKYGGVPFELPGGGLMEGKSFLETAIIEVKQEVRINVRDEWDSHIYYISEQPESSQREWTTWGDYTQICCGIADTPYTGDIDEQDKDPDMMNNSKWVNIEEVDLTPAHEQAIREYKGILYSRDSNHTNIIREALEHIW
jgi:8-oxo-dGTP pyrophosphatase MutT (NUDIX family)